MSVFGLWLETAESGWVRADQVIQVAPDRVLEQRDAGDQHVVLAGVTVSQSSEGEVGPQIYRVAYFATEQSARRAAFSLVHCLATHGGTAGLVRLIKEQAEVTPFGELRRDQVPA